MVTLTGSDSACPRPSPGACQDLHSTVSLELLCPGCQPDWGEERQSFENGLSQFFLLLQHGLPCDLSGRSPCDLLPVAACTPLFGPLPCCANLTWDAFETGRCLRSTSLTLSSGSVDVFSKNLVSNWKDFFFLYC